MCSGGTLNNDSNDDVYSKMAEMMKILVGWDNETEADLIRLYLNVDESGIVTTTNHEQTLLLATTRNDWDAILITTNYPDHDIAFEVFQKIRAFQTDTPIIAACSQDDVYRLAKYMTNGLRSYLIRDSAGDYMFLLSAVIENAVNQLQAERARLLAEKLRREIDSVRQLQEAIIPRDIATPEEYSVAARYESSQIQILGGSPVTMAGGDYYDVFTLPDESVIILVGDASGHGMKACMSIMTMHTLIRMIRYDEYRDPAHFVQYVNEQLSRQTLVNSEGGFITLFYGVLNPKTNELKWASAGHQPPIIHNFEDDSVREVDHDPEAAGLPIGIMEGAAYQTQTTPIPPNSRLMCYTDGLTEAFPADAEDHQEFGITGVAATLRSCKNSDLNSSLDRLFFDSQEFTNGQGRHDDTSVLLLERKTIPADQSSGADTSRRSTAGNRLQKIVASRP